MRNYSSSLQTPIEIQRGFARKKRYPLGRYILILGVVAVMVAFLSDFINKIGVFAIRDVKVIGVEPSEKDEIINALEIDLMGTQKEQPSIDQMLARIKKVNYVRNVKLHRNFLRRELNVKIEKREAFAKIKFIEKDLFFFILSTLKVLC